MLSIHWMCPVYLGQMLYYYLYFFLIFFLTFMLMALGARNIPVAVLP